MQGSDTHVVALVLWSMKNTRPLGATAVAQPGGSGSSASVMVWRDGDGPAGSDCRQNSVPKRFRKQPTHMYNLQQMHMKM